MFKRIISALMITVLLLSFMSACSRGQTQTDAGEQHANFGETYAVYKNRLYSAGMASYRIYEFNIDKLTAGETDYIDSVCKDSLCAHNTAYCAAYLNASSANVLVEATENVMPTLYVTYLPIIMNISGSDISTESGKGTVMKIDLNTGTKKLLANQLESSAYQFASYGDSLYFTTTGKTDSGMRDRIGRISKDGGEITYYTPEEDTRLHLIDIVDGTVYFNDLDGNIYTADEKLDKVERLYTLPELMTSVNDAAADYCIRIYQGYLYFRQNYRATGYSDHYASDYYRLSIDHLQDEPELICENLLTTHLYGFAGDRLYYAKSEFQDGYKVINPNTHMEQSRVTETGGNVYAYDLASKTESKVISDCGVDFGQQGNLLTDQYLVTFSASAYQQERRDGFYMLDLTAGSLSYFEIPGTGSSF